MTLLEVCVDNAEGLSAAIAGGADRIELCAALSTGGLTPSPGLIALAADSSATVRAMIRPRAGDFTYGEVDLDAMRRDIDAVRQAGLAGVVIGATNAQGDLDEAALALLVQQAEGLAVTLHRAVDLLPDPIASVEIAVALGIDTILTSGGARTAEEGLGNIARMHYLADGRIAIMAGSGVKASNVAHILAHTGVEAIHASCGRLRSPAGSRALAFGFAAPDQTETDPVAVAALRAALEEASFR